MLSSLSFALFNLQPPFQLYYFSIHPGLRIAIYSAIIVSSFRVSYHEGSNRERWP